MDRKKNGQEREHTSMHANLRENPRMAPGGKAANVYTRALAWAIAAALVLGLAARAFQPAGGGATRPAILGIAHIALRASSLANARRFYGDLLGYAERQPARANTVAVFIVNDRQRIVIHEAMTGDSARGSQGSPRAQVSGVQGAPRVNTRSGALGPPRSGMSGVQGAPRVNDERLLHVAFETADVAALRTYLSARGVTASEPAADPDGGGRAIDVTDPDGHRVRFLQRDGSAAPQRLPISARGSQGSPRAQVSGVQGAPRVSDDRRISRRILHGGYTIGDAAAADRFYKDVLGFAEIWRGGRDDGVTSWINMRVPDGTDYLEYMLVSGSVDRRQLGVLHHVALVVPDIQEALEAVRLRADERNARATPQVGRNGRWQLNLYDPDGTRVEFMEPWTIR